MYEHYFRKFGKNAGFKNSFYEKYVFVPAGATNLIGEGTPILMNAMPFENDDGFRGRYVIYRVHAGAYSKWWVDEDRLQEAFRASGVQIPSPVPAAPVPRPPGRPPRPQSIRETSVWYLADEIDRSARFPITKIVLVALFGSFVFLIYWFGFRQKSGW